MEDRIENWGTWPYYGSPQATSIWDTIDPDCPDAAPKPDLLPAEPPGWARESMISLARQRTVNENAMARMRNSMMKADEYIEVVRKDEPGLGPVPEFASLSYRIPYMRQKPTVGSSPFEYQLEYPKTIKALGEMRPDLIVDLSIFYNNMFSIDPEDAIETQRWKFARFIGLAVMQQ